MLYCACSVSYSQVHVLSLSTLRYYLAVYLAVAAFALIEFSIIPVVELGGRYAAQIKPNLFMVLPSFLDWAACVAAIVFGVALAPGRKGAMAVGLAFTFACVHFGQILLILSFAPAIGDGIVPLSITYYGGLLVTGAVLCLIWEQVAHRHGVAHGRALAAISGPSIYGRALRSQAEIPPSMVPSESGFFDFDLILLEDELLKIKPDRSAYVSSLLLGLAIERDCGYVNCRARSFTFCQLMLDVAMRLAVTAEDSLERQGWLSLAEDFRHYHDSAERPVLLQRAQDKLEAMRLPGGQTAPEEQLLTV